MVGVEVAEADAGDVPAVGDGVGEGFARAAFAGREGFRTFWSRVRRGVRKLEDRAGGCRLEVEDGVNVGVVVGCGAGVVVGVEEVVVVGGEGDDVVFGQAVVVVVLVVLALVAAAVMRRGPFIVGGPVAAAVSGRGGGRVLVVLVGVAAVPVAAVVGVGERSTAAGLVLLVDVGLFVVRSWAAVCLRSTATAAGDDVAEVGAAEAPGPEEPEGAADGRDDVVVVVPGGLEELDDGR